MENSITEKIRNIEDQIADIDSYLQVIWSSKRETAVSSDNHAITASMAAIGFIFSLLNYSEGEWFGSLYFSAVTYFVVSISVTLLGFYVADREHAATAKNLISWKNSLRKYRRLEIEIGEGDYNGKLSAEEARALLKQEEENGVRSLIYGQSACKIWIAHTGPASCEKQRIYD